MASTSAEPGPSAASQERAREGIEHLQTAARELILAARAALDVAEEVVNDPDALASLAGTFSAVGDLARRFTGTGGWPMPAGRSGDGGGPSGGASTGGAPDRGATDDAPRVQRITVTP